MAVPKLEKLTELLKDFLGPGKTVIDHETARLTAVGENYGSLMLSVKIKVKNKNQTETLEAVAKVPPPGEFMQKMFNTPVTFRNEINFYKIIVPELKLFLQEHGIDNYFDCFPKFFGARLSLGDNNFADNDAVLLLENLKKLNYELGDRNVGFDLKTAKLILKDLAKFHAIPLAMKLLRPQDFQSKIKALFTPYKVFDFDGVDMSFTVIEKTQSIVDDIEGCKQYSQKVGDALKSSHQFLQHPKNTSTYMREPFATIIHTDAWVNNFMVQFIDGEPVKCKILDFQLCEYGSPARDVIFFIYSSLQISVVQRHYDELIETYHQAFIENLEKLECDIAPFSLQEFQREIKLVMADCEFFHCLIMLEPIYATKDSVKELDQYNEDDMTKKHDVPENHKEKAAFIIEDCVRRNFI